MTSDTALTSDSALTSITEIIVPGVVDPDGVIVNTRPVPAPGGGQALVALLAAGVSFGENSMRRGRYPGQPKFPFVLGYDLVGEVLAVGPGADPSLVGRRVAAVTKTGAWSSKNVLDARDLVTIGDDVDPAQAETVLLNGITAWQMLHRSAKVRAGQTVLVHGASGGVGGLLVQLARLAGARVIGTGSPRHHDALRALGAEPLDYHDADLAAQLSELAPGGLDAVFDNLGGDSFERSFRSLAPGGTLVAYGTASEREGTDNMLLSFAGVFARFAGWTLAPNGGRSATFYNFWGGSRLWPTRFRARLAADLRSVLALVRSGQLTAEIAARVPLAEAARALALAEARETRGKVILEP